MVEKSVKLNIYEIHLDLEHFFKFKFVTLLLLSTAIIVFNYIVLYRN